MGELSYEDVRRAAQDAVRDFLRTIISELQSSRDDIRRSLQQINAGQYQLNDITARLTTLQQQINTLSSALRTNNGNGTTTSQLMQTIQQSSYDLQRRLRSVEEFMQSCYTYLATTSALERQHDRW